MAESKPKILFIEDDPSLRKFLRAALESDYELVEAANGESGVRHAAYDRPDLIILDLGLPDVDGIEVTRRVREWSTTPIIVVSARGKEQDKVVALDAGADDYLTKPFGIAELTARVRVALRHSLQAGRDDADPVYVSGDLQIDFTSRVVKVNDQPVHLTNNEFRLLAVLAKHAGMILTHGQLLKDVWGPGHQQENHYLRVYMNQLRRKIEADPARPKHLLTETGVGYRLE